MASDYIVLIFSSIFPLAVFKKINLIKVAAIETLSVLKLRLGNFSLALLIKSKFSFQNAGKLMFFKVYDENQNSIVFI